MWPPIDQLTTQGYDLQVGTNVLGHFLLTQLLLPGLRAASTSGAKARVVTTASFSTYLTNELRLEIFVDGPARRNAGTKELYIQSKFVRHMSCFLLNNESGVGSYCCYVHQGERRVRARTCSAVCRLCCFDGGQPWYVHFFIGSCNISVTDGIGVGLP
jgi:hypothetical protein